MSEKISKSVHITNYYHKNSGGISTSFNNLMAAADRHRRRVTVIVPGERRHDEKVNDFATLRWVPAKKSPIFDKRYRLIMPWQYMPADSELREILLEEQPDMIEVTDKYTLSMLGPMIRIGKFKQIGRPMLVHFSAERMDDNIGSFVSGGGTGRNLARAVMANYLLPGFDFHIANSDYTAEEFHESIRWTDSSFKKRLMNITWRFLCAPRTDIRERLRVCPRGVDTETFGARNRDQSKRARLTDSIGASNDSVIILYAGRLSPEKNIGLLSETMRILSKDTKDYRLVVAGAGPLEDSFRAAAEKESPGKVTMLGHVDKTRLADLYANANLFVHPNPREPFGIAPLEAMVSGVATVAPRSGGILSYANDDNAWLVATDAESFASAIKEVVSDDDERRRRTANAVATGMANSREHSTDNLFATYDSMYEDFQHRNELFCNREKASDFDYADAFGTD